MGTLFTLTIETRTGRADPRRWACVAAFEIGKAYDLALLDDDDGARWIEPELERDTRARRNARPDGAAARDLGYVFSRCPACAGDLEGTPGAYVCRSCGATCSRPGLYDGDGRRAPGDDEARAELERLDRERAELLEREPFRLGEPDADHFGEEPPRCYGVRDVPTVIARIEVCLRERAGEEPGIYSVAFAAMLAALERVASSPIGVRCVMWGR